MSRNARRVLMACYGGGHVHSLIPVARELARDEGISLTVLGFTTARAAFVRAGVPARGYGVIEDYLVQPCPELVPLFIDNASHPDVSAAETFAYFHVGLHDLIQSHGQVEALRLVTERGRVAFQPEATLGRYLEATRPDLVITSTSPRSELAMQRAARSLGIPGLAISDLFLQHESAYLCAEGYAPHITVIAEHVAGFLHQAGCTRSEIHVTGNPAFDSLFTPEARAAGRAIRQRFHLDGQTRLLTWIGTPGEISLRGKAFVDSQAIIAWLEDFCRRHPGHRFAFRPHPNRPLRLPEGIRHGLLLDGEFPIESVIWASDALLLETSTVGLQAALIDRPVITVGADNYPPYEALGLATGVNGLDTLEHALLPPKKPRLDLLGPAGMGDATARVVRLIHRLLGGGTGKEQP